MILKLFAVLLISSVVIASESSCDNVGNVTAKDAKYLKFNGGFFYIHGLTNGESVVMYKTPDDKHISVQYTFLNSDCLYETRRYNIIENGTFVDHSKDVEEPGKFSVSKSLKFVADGKDVELNFEINEKGFVLNKGIEVTAIETFEVKLPKETPEHAPSAAVSNNISAFEFADKDTIELTDLKDGKFFYQKYSKMNSIIGTYILKTSSGDYYSVDYTIENPFQDNSLMNLERK
ncbi:unnamed protein product [Diamesa hyperborea]